MALMKTAVYILWTVLAWLSVRAYAQTITLQPLGVEGDEEDLNSFNPMEFEVRDMDISTQIVAIRRGPDIIADDANNRESVFARLGLDPDKYLITKELIRPDDDRHYTLRINDPTPVDTANFTFIVCGKILSNSTCNESSIVLVSDTVGFTVNYLPGDAYPNCSVVANDGPPTAGAPRGDRWVFLGQPTVLSCQSEIGRPQVQLAWEKNGQGVESDMADEQVFRYARHTFTPSLVDEGAVFACNLTRPDLPDLRRSCALVVDVVSEPSVAITFDNTNGDVVLGSTVVFTCSATTDTSSINGTAWTTPGELQNATDRYSIDGNRFTLTDVQEGDDGVSIACTATDGDGIEKTVKVVVQTTKGADLPSKSITTIAPTTDVEGVITPTPTDPPEDNTAIIIGSLFAGLLLTVPVVVVAMWYWSQRRGKKLHQDDRSRGTVAGQPHVKRRNPKDPAVHQNTSFDQKDLQFTPDDDQYPMRYNSPDVVPRGTRYGSPVRSDSLERQEKGPSSGGREDVVPVRRAADLSLEDRSPSPSYDKHRLRDEYKHGRDDRGYGDFIDSGYPVKHSYRERYVDDEPYETGENRYQDTSDDQRWDADRVDNFDSDAHEGSYDPGYDFQNRWHDEEYMDSDRPVDGNRYDYDNDAYEGGSDDQYVLEQAKAEVYDKDYADCDQRSDIDRYDYDKDAYDDRGSYDEYSHENSYDGRYGDPYGDHAKPDHEDNDLGEGDPYYSSHDDEGSFGRRTESDFSEERGYVPTYGRGSPTDDRHDYNPGTYVLQDDGYDGTPSYV